VVNKIKAKVLKKEILFVVIKPNVPTIVACDVVRIKRVIQSLLLHSVRFMRKHGKITISFEKSTLNIKGTSVPDFKVLIADQGVGIPQDALDRIFSDKTSKTRTKADSKELQFAMCKKIIDVHKGNIFAQNNPDGGVTFNIVLPYEQDEASTDTD